MTDNTNELTKHDEQEALSDDQLTDAAGGAAAATPVREKAIQDLEAVKDGIRD